MSTAWNYFKSYEIVEDMGLPNIVYKDGGDYDYNSKSEIKMMSALNVLDIEVPSYMKCEPPSSGELELIEPKLLAQACVEIIELLRIEDVPAEKVTIKNELIECADGDIEELIDLIETLKDWSEEGNYITIDID